MKNRTAVALGSCLALLLCGCAEPVARQGVQLHGPNCNLKTPPAGSANADAHGTTLALFPRTVAADYTGCQTIWAVADQVVLWYTSTLYRQGSPAVFISRRVQGAKWRETVCYFDGDRLVDRVDWNGGADEQCPEPATLAHK
jgi:hypothetical protein